MSTLTKVPFYYVRHGRTDWNVQQRPMGQQNIPLNATGINQALLARDCLVGIGITTICHSPLLRAKKTAEIFNEVLGCQLVEINELREFDLGPYEGQVKDKWFYDWKTGIELPGTESYADFMHRSLIGINQALSRPGLVLVVAHGGVYGAIERALQSQIEGGLQNCVPIFHEPPTNLSGTWRCHSKVGL
jgi:broad specificity phosphatase PhoE